MSDCPGSSEPALLRVVGTEILSICLVCGRVWRGSSRSPVGVIVPVHSGAGEREEGESDGDLDA